MITININGSQKTCEVQPGDYLAQVIREKLGMTGTKRGCDTGGCGMCTVLLDGKPIYSCMTPAWMTEGRKITTIEGISPALEVLDPIQKSMIDSFAFQCGYCTGAMILVGKSLLDANPHPTEEEVRKAMCGVLCRCTNYEGYIDAILLASKGKS
jgi:aerobic-type carbon monoxide dehydrogenase small subunit (CoxS/CutS family)